MVSLSWTPTTPLSRTLVARRHGEASGAAGVALAELSGFELVQVMARRGQWPALAEVVAQRYGAVPPSTPQAVRAGGKTLIWSGPDQFFALSARDDAAPEIDDAKRAFAGIASLSDQSDARALLRLSGPKARAALAKFCSLDLHDAAFPVGAAAATSIDHTSVTLWRGGDSDGDAVFHLLVFSTFAESLLGTILDSAAEYGVEVVSSSAWQP